MWYSEGCDESNSSAVRAALSFSRTSNDGRIAPADCDLANGLVSGKCVDGQRLGLRELK